MSGLSPTASRLCYRRLATLSAALVAAIATPRATPAEITSDDIEDAVNYRIQNDAYFNENSVTASVERQQVTLRGQVPNIVSKVRAERIAETVPGVIEVSNQIRVPRAERRDDDELQEAIISRFARDPYLGRYGINATVQNGVATLNGNVPRRMYGDAALDLASEIDGLTDVRNNISVAATGDDQEGVDDPVLNDGNADRVRQKQSTDPEGAARDSQPPQADSANSIDDALRSDGRIDADSLDYSNNDGVVSVSGTVRTLAQKRIIMNRLSRVDGVQDVDLSDLKVDASKKPSADPSNRQQPTDQQIERRVRQRLEQAPRLTASGIDVAVQDREVMLSGSVPLAGERRRAVGEARMVPGVKGVRQDLKVADRTDTSTPTFIPGDDTPRDKEAGDAASDAVQKRVDDLLERIAPQATARVANGLVNLEGSAANGRQLVRSLEDLKGVKSVTNNLDNEGGTAGYAADPYIDGVGSLAILQDENGLYEELDGGMYGMSGGQYALTRKEFRKAMSNDAPGGIEFAKPGTARPADRETAVAGTTEAGIATDGVTDKQGPISGAGGSRATGDSDPAGGTSRKPRGDRQSRRGDAGVAPEVADDLGPFDDVDTDDDIVSSENLPAGNRGVEIKGAELREKVKKALAASPYLTSSEVAVEASTAGTVQLTGAVNSYVEWAAARKAAYEAGAKEVRMNVRVY